MRLRYLSFLLLLSSSGLALQRSQATAEFGSAYSCPGCTSVEALGSAPEAPTAPLQSPNQSVTSPTGLTLDEALRIAVQNHPRLQGAAAVVSRANSLAATARAYSNPLVEVFQGPQYARPIATPGVPGLLQHYAAYQPIEIPRERHDRLRIAQLTAEGSRFGEAGVLLSVTTDVKRAFYDVLRRREEVSHTQENLDLVQELRRRVQVEVDVGEKGKLELTRAEAELGRARFAVRGAQLELANAIALLRIAMGAPANATLDPQGDLETRRQLPPLPELRDLVLKTHPYLQQSEKDHETAQAALDHERSLRIPQPTFFAEYENQPDLRYWRAGFTVPLPLWDRRRGQIEGAKASIRETTAITDQRRLELIAATERAYEQYQLADQQATSLESGELHAAESAVQAAQAAYRFGERGIVEVLDAQRVLQSVRDDLLNARFARQNALTDLEALGAVSTGGSR